MVDLWDKLDVMLQEIRAERRVRAPIFRVQNADTWANVRPASQCSGDDPDSHTFCHRSTRRESDIGKAWNAYRKACRPRPERPLLRFDASGRL